MAQQSATKGAFGPGEPRGAGGLIAALVLLGLALLLAISLSGPPPPKAKDAPVADFSAGRAGEVLRDLLGDGAPHPVGSPANARVRERVLAQLRTLGYSPEVQEGFTCKPGWGCAKVWNVLARLPGRQAGKAVLLVAHYDSVGAGPGASDDMTGTAAVIEVARVLKAGPQPRNTVLFLLADGEEAGLLGAKAFAETSPTASEVGVVVNLEARGTGGPSLMFQASPDDAWLLDAWAPRASRPFTSSLFSTIYRFMPNDTDLTVFLNRGVPGMNFAFIEHPSHYHTPLDNLADASPASLQHHGDNALVAVRGLAEADLAHPPRGGAVYFDLLHLAVVRWPSALSPVLGLAALILMLVAAWLACRRGLATWRAVVLGAVSPLLSLVLSLLLAYGLRMALEGAFASRWAARPLPAMIAFWLLPLAVTLALGGFLGRRSGSVGLWAGVWTGWSMFGIALSLTLPGLTYLFLAPALVVGILGVAVFAAGGSAAGRLAVTVIPALVVGLLWFPVLGSLYTGLGLLGLLATSILLAFVYSTLIPLAGPAGALGRRWLPLAAAAAAALGALLALVSPPNSPQVPRDILVNLYEEAGTGDTRWVVFSDPPLPPALRQAAPFGQEPSAPFPWLPGAAGYVAPASRLEAPGPELAVLEDATTGGKRHLRLRLTSPRGAPVARLAVPAGARIESIKIDGHAFPAAAEGDRGSGSLQGWRIFSYLTLPPEGAEVDVVLGSAQPADWYVIDRSNGLPLGAAALLAARPKDATTIQDGDLVVVSRKVKI